MLEKDRLPVDAMILFGLEPITWAKSLYSVNKIIGLGAFLAWRSKISWHTLFITADSLYQKLVKDPIQLQAKPLTYSQLIMLELAQHYCWIPGACRSR